MQNFSHIENKLYKDLSLTMKRKLNILIALLACKNPDILYFDEPFTGLDVNEQHTLCHDILQLKQKCSIVMVSHHLEVLR